MDVNPTQEQEQRSSATVGQARELARFGRDGVTTKALLEHPHVRALLVALEPGQEIPMHAPAVELVVTVADGIGEIRLGDSITPLRAGDVAVVPAGETRGIRARSARLVLIAVLTPPPSEADHAPAADSQWPHEREPESGPASLIRAEHAEPRPHLGHLGVLADELEVREERQLRERLEGVVAFLRDGILAHAGIEEATAYPAAERLLRALGGATGTMVLEHELIAARVAELEGLTAAERYDGPTRAELRRSLIGLEAVLRGHFDKEEQVYLPLLEHLTPCESEALTAQLERAAARGHDH
jgi:quercetin dioxygenase-like cupin family protein/hemerythrin-like domain-containing protein